MANIKIGKFTISPQSGSPGEDIAIGHTLSEAHTGRSSYQKLVRASISNAGANASATETLVVNGAPVKLTLNTSQLEIAYNVTTATINGVSNAARFRVSSTGKAITLVTNTGYTVSGNEGTFSNGFGTQDEGAVAIKVQFDANNTTSTVTIPVKVEYIDGTTWKVAGTFNILQSSSDADVVFTITPSTLSAFANTGGSQTVSISSNVGYSIEVQGDVSTDWVTLDRTTGTASTSNLKITAAAQAVGAAAREVSLKFKSTITGSVIGTLAISQLAGDAFAISWESNTLTFEPDAVGDIQTNKLTSNGDWYIEEVIS